MAVSPGVPIPQCVTLDGPSCNLNVRLAEVGRQNGGDAMRTVVVALVFLLMASGLCMAQTNKQGPSSKSSGDNEKTVAAVDYTRSINQSLYFQRPQVELPAGETGWTLEVDISGGYVPSHKSITVTSKGRVTIEDSNGSCSFEVEDGVPEIDRLIAEANAAGWGGGLAED